MGVRRVRAADAAVIAGLLSELGYPQSEAVVATRLTGWLGAEQAAVFGWADDADLLGVIAVHVVPFFERDGGWARIVALVVSDRARRRGAGAALVAAAEEFALARGCTMMEVTSSRQRDGAHAFYRRLGYVDRCTDSGRFTRQLPASEGAS